MAWRFDRPEHCVFSQNPLVATVVELRYHPILKIGITQGVPEFQDQVRNEFPEYSEVKNQVVRLMPPSPSVEMREENQFRFTKEGVTTTLTLSDSAISLENRKHQSHLSTLRDMQTATSALANVFSPIRPTRLGMRYINVIDRSLIGHSLNQEVNWNQLINAEFLKMPRDLADLSDTAYWMEVDSPMPSSGNMTLRYGIQRDAAKAIGPFRFDIDRYHDGPFDINATCDLLREFALDIHALFMMMAGPKLLQWMGPKQE